MTCADIGTLGLVDFTVELRGEVSARASWQPYAEVCAKSAGIPEPRAN